MIMTDLVEDLDAIEGRLLDLQIRLRNFRLHIQDELTFDDELALASGFTNSDDDCECGRQQNRIIAKRFGND